MLNAMQYIYLVVDNLCPFGSKRNIYLSAVESEILSPSDYGDGPCRRASILLCSRRGLPGTSSVVVLYSAPWFYCITDMGYRLAVYKSIILLGK